MNSAENNFVYVSILVLAVFVWHGTCTHMWDNQHACTASWKFLAEASTLRPRKFSTRDPTFSMQRGVERGSCILKSWDLAAKPSLKRFGYFNSMRVDPASLGEAHPCNLWLEGCDLLWATKGGLHWPFRTLCGLTGPVSALTTSLT